MTLVTDKITPLLQKTIRKYTVTVYDYADTWNIPQPCPANWHEIVYRVTIIKDGFVYELAPYEFSSRIAKVGAEMVEKYNQSQVKSLI